MVCSLLLLLSHPLFLLSQLLPFPVYFFYPSPFWPKNSFFLLLCLILVFFLFYSCLISCSSFWSTPLFTCPKKSYFLLLCCFWCYSSCPFPFFYVCFQSSFSVTLTSTSFLLSTFFFVPASYPLPCFACPKETHFLLLCLLLVSSSFFPNVTFVSPTVLSLLSFLFFVYFFLYPSFPSTLFPFSQNVKTSFFLLLLPLLLVSHLLIFLLFSSFSPLSNVLSSYIYTLFVIFPWFWFSSFIHVQKVSVYCTCQTKQK